MYDCDKMILYISNSQKKAFVRELINEYKPRKVLIKNIYITVEQFLKKIKTIQNISFTREKNLMNSVDDIFSKQLDILGLGLPEEACMSAQFNTSVTHKFETFMRKFKDNKKNLEYNNLVCIGKDDKDFEFTFNTETFQQKINIPSQREENGFFSENEIRKGIISRITKSDVF